MMPALSRSAIRRYIVLVVILGLLFVPFPANNLWWREAINSGHTVFFAILSLVLYRYIKATTSLSNAIVIYLLILVIGMVFGAAIELLQSFVHRESSLNDIYGDFIGLMAGLCLIAAYDLKGAKSKKFFSPLLMFASSGFLLLGMFSLIQLSWYYIERYNAFPEIIDFGADWSSGYVRFDNATLLTAAESRKNISLYPVRFNRAEFAGISIIEPEPDWSKYQSLHFHIFSKYQRDTVLYFWVQDDKHNLKFSDRYNKRLLILPGLNEIEISLNQISHGPVNRELDLGNVSRIKLYSTKLDGYIQLEVSNIYLQ